MHKIIKNNDAGNLEKLLQNGNTLTLNDPFLSGHYYTPVQAAIAYNAPECFDLLIKAGANPYNYRYLYGGNALVLAIQQAVFGGNIKYFDEVYKFPKLELIHGINELSKKKYNNGLSYELFIKILEHPNIQYEPIHPFYLRNFF